MNRVCGANSVSYPHSLCTLQCIVGEGISGKQKDCRILWTQNSSYYTAPDVVSCGNCGIVRSCTVTSRKVYSIIR